MIIAIDGPSGTGKSTVARAVAKRLNFSFFDTGAMYRSVAWKVLKEGVNPHDQKAVEALMSTFRIRMKTSRKGERKYFIDKQEITKEIRTPKITSVASQIAIYPEVRAKLVSIQRSFGYKTNAVFEGRDMGTVVFPDADLKIFLTARSQVRAERRYRELLIKFPDLAKSLSFEALLKEMEERDETDSNRAISPLRQAQDAILIDTSDLTIEEVIEKIIENKPLHKKKFAPMKLSYRIVYTLARLYFKIFFRLEIYGVKHFRKGPGVIAANHASFLDPPVLSISCPEEVHFLAKESLFKIPFLGRLIRILNTHPLAKNASDAHTFRLMIELLGQGKKLILFPEGNRTFDGKIQPLKRGLPFLVMKAKTSIFPAYIEGTFDAWSRKRKIPKPWGKIKVVFGTPLQWEQFEGHDKREVERKILERTDTSIRSLKAWLENGANGSPP